MAVETPIVLVHGGGFDHRCWDRLVPLLDGPVLAVDLPGRGRHPAPFDAVDLAACAEAVAGDVDEAGFDEIVLVGHSLAGCSMPAIVGVLGARVQRCVFVACTVPDDGQSVLDTLDPELQELARAAADLVEPVLMDGAIAELVLGNDLDADQLAWCVERMVPEVPGLIFEPVDLSPLGRPMPRLWVRTLGDTILAPDKQLRGAANVGDCPVVDLAAGHMCMVSQPEALAAILRGASA